MAQLQENLENVICAAECHRDKYKNTTNDNTVPVCLFYADMEKWDHYFHSSSMVLFEKTHLTTADVLIMNLLVARQYSFFITGTENS